MAKKRQKPDTNQRHNYSAEFKREAVQMLLDNHSAASIVERIGIPGTSLSQKLDPPQSTSPPYQFCAAACRANYRI